MAEECMVLLKNQTPQSSSSLSLSSPLLPLKQGTKLFVCGPNADSFRTMNGGWTYTWQGNKTDEVCGKIGKYRTFLGALEAKFGKDNVEYSPMVAYDASGNANMGEDFRLDHQVPELLIADGNSTGDKINRADVIVAFIGENSYTETVGNIDDLTLSQNQLDMVKALAATGKPVILVLNEGRPRIINEIEPLAAAIVHTFLPGNYGGDALANLLAGDANFSGRMPYTYPKYHGSFITYDCKPCEYVETMDGAYNYEANTTVQWPFGYGLSYTTVKYSNLAYRKDGETLTFTVDLENLGDEAVKEPVLLFVSDLVASLTPDIKRLRAFDKVALAGREKKTVTLSIKVDDLAFVDNDLQWVVEPGEFKAAVGGQTLVFELK